ncbi:MAG: DUF4845 domain-containing protein [Gammaproteobacteria bacterium]
MEPHRRPYRIDNPRRRRQAGLTALSGLLLATVFGVVGLAALKITPLYVQGMRVRTVMADLKEDLEGRGATSVANIRIDINSRLYVEGISLRGDDLTITPGRNGYTVRVEYDNRSRFLANIWFLVLIDEQIEIRR